ncbi:MAG: phage tail spike protein [Eubacteriales bacterium]|nr:phage tail spike protein [Eubacteriales bacterium]
MTIYFFDKDFGITAIPPADEIIAYDDKRTLNGLHSASLTCTYLKEVEEAFYFGSKDPDHPDNFLLFRISSQIKYEGKMDLIGVHIFFYELQGEITRDIRPRGVPAWSALQRILVDSIWQPGVNQSTKTGAGSFYYQSKLSAFQEFLELWGVEFRARLAFNESKIVGRYVDLYDDISADYGKRYEYGDKLISVEAETSNDHLYTGILPLGKGEEVGEGYGRKIRITNVKWSKAGGDPEDKPEGSDILEDSDSITKFGRRIAVIDFPDQDNREELIKDAYEELQRLNRPKVEFRSAAIEPSKVDLGETVTIVRRDIGITYKTRVFEIERNLLNDSVKAFRFGDRVIKTQSQRIKSTEKIIRDNAEETAELYNKGQEALNGLEETLSQELDDLNTELADNERDVEEAMRLTDIKIEDYYRDAKNKIEESYYNEDAYEYRLKTGNAYGLPAGTYSFNAPIDQNPTKVTYYGAGKILIANRKKADGEWDWTTFVTGDGLGANMVDAHSIQAGAVTSAAIQAEAVTSDKIMAGAITAGKIGAGAIISNKIAAGAVTANAIQSGAITSSKILAGAITTDKLSAYNVYSLNGTFTGTIKANDGYFKGKLEASTGSFGSLTVYNNRTQGNYYGGLNNCLGSVKDLGGSLKGMGGTITNMGGSVSSLGGSLNKTLGIHAGQTTGSHTGNVNSSSISGSLNGVSGSARLTNSTLSGNFNGTAATTNYSTIGGNLQNTDGIHAGQLKCSQGYLGNTQFYSSNGHLHFNAGLSVGGQLQAMGGLVSSRNVAANSGTVSGQYGSFKYLSYTTINQNSDERLKENFESIPDDLIDAFYKLPLIKYNFKERPTKPKVGINASELFWRSDSQLKPFLIGVGPDGYLTADYSCLANIGLAALQQLNLRVQKLEEIGGKSK